MTLYKKYFSKPIIFVLIIIVCSNNSLQSQTIKNATVQKGLDDFYAAEFEQAIQTLEESLLEVDLQPDELFSAHVYIGFSKIRLGEDPNIIRSHFVNAIKSFPEMDLDESKIPPDLFRQYKAVRDQIMCTLIVYTNPENASAILIHPQNEKIENFHTPAEFTNMLEGTFQLLVSLDGYKAYTTVLELKPGQFDTLNITLLKKEKSFIQKYWPYGAGVLAATAAVLVVTSNGKEKPAEPADKNLPFPPGRPD